MSEPPLKSLHSYISLSQAKLGQLDKLTNQEIMDSLKPGQPGLLKIRPDGMIIEGHHRIKILRDRGFNVDALPREIIPKN